MGISRKLNSKSRITWLNFTFVIHSVCIFIAIRSSDIDSKIVLELMAGDVFYRLFSVYLFWKGKKAIIGQVQDEVIQPVQVMDKRD